MDMNQNREHGGDAYLTTGAAARRLRLRLRLTTLPPMLGPSHDILARFGLGP